MQFNIKIVEYEEADTATIAVFRDYVGVSDNIDRTTKANREKNKNEIYEINPFDGEVVTETFYMPEELYAKKCMSINKSLARARRRIRQLIRAVKWEYFVTLTFNQKKVNRQDFNTCCRKTRNWLQNIRKKAEDLKFICIPELHSDMVSWHMHILLADTGDIEFKDSEHKNEYGKTIYNIPAWRYGFSTAIEVDNTNLDSTIKLSNYVTKYMTKESSHIAKNRNRFFASNNIPKPKETRCSYTDTLSLDLILEEFEEKYEIVWQNDFKGYVSSKFYEGVRKCNKE